MAVEEVVLGIMHDDFCGRGCNVETLYLVDTLAATRILSDFLDVR